MSPESEHSKRLWNQWDQLEIHNGLVYRRYTGSGSNDEYKQLLVPRCCVENVLFNTHTGMAGGHFGQSKTLFQVKRRFHWGTWKTDVIRYCRQCPQCCRYYRGKLPRQAPLQPVIAGAPMERLYVDVTGPHPVSSRGNQYIVTCMDGFSKWAEAFAVKHNDAETIATLLVEQVFCRYGAPLSLLTDQGKDVDGNLMRAVCELLGIEKLRTSPYKPSTDAVEKMHRTLNAVLGKTVSEHQKDWDQRLPAAMAAYRASRHDSTGYSPNRLVLGRETRMPVDIIYGTAEEEPVVDYDSYVGALQEKLVSAYEEVRKELRTAAQKYKRQYDIKVRPHRYMVGQWVYYFNPRKYAGKQDKWLRKFDGPFLVIATPTPVNVVIQRSSRAKPMTVHLDKVKPYTGPEPISWLKPESTGPPNTENVAAPSAGHEEPDTGLLENDPGKIHSPQIRTPGIRPQRTRRPPRYLAGYEWTNQAVTGKIVRSI